MARNRQTEHTLKPCVLLCFLLLCSQRAGSWAIAPTSFPDNARHSSRTDEDKDYSILVCFRCRHLALVWPLLCGYDNVPCHFKCIWPQNQRQRPWTHLFTSTGIAFLSPLSLPASTGIRICSSVADYIACQRSLAWSVSVPHLPWMSGFQSLLGRNCISEHNCAMCSHLTTSFSNIKVLLA